MNHSRGKNNRKIYINDSVSPQRAVQKTGSSSHAKFVQISAKPVSYVVRPLKTSCSLSPSTGRQEGRPRNHSHGGMGASFSRSQVDQRPPILVRRGSVTAKVPNAPMNNIVLTSNKTACVLCPNCGVQSVTVDRCSSCKKEIMKDRRTHDQVIIDRIKETQKEVVGIQKGISARSFYANSRQENNVIKHSNATNSGLGIRKRATTRVAAKKAAVTVNDCITISSDSEDDENMSASEVSDSSNQPQTPTSSTLPTNSVSESCQDVDEEVPKKKQKLDSQPSTSDPIETPSEKSPQKINCEKAILNLVADSIRIGQLKLTPKSVVRVSNDSVSGCLFCPRLKASKVLTIKWSSVTLCEICSDLKEPCLYLTLTSGSLPGLREEFDMVKGEYPYYDPAGAGDQRYFTIYMNPKALADSLQCSVERLRQKFGIIRRKLKKPADFLKEISYEDSERRQSLAAALELQRDPNWTDTLPTLSSAQSVIVKGSTANTTTTTSPAVTRSQNKDSLEDDSMVFMGPREEYFVYPPPPIKGGISVTNEDEFCLNHGEFLNDIIIDFYLKYTYNEILSNEDRERSHIFSCFFYERLMQKGKKSGEFNPAERRHNQVKKWTRNVDIFSKDFIFIPINEASHWYLAVICFPGLNGDVLEIVRSDGTKQKISNFNSRGPDKSSGLITVNIPKFKMKNNTESKPPANSDQEKLPGCDTSTCDATETEMEISKDCKSETDKKTENPPESVPQPPHEIVAQTSLSGEPDTASKQSDSDVAHEGDLHDRDVSHTRGPVITQHTNTTVTEVSDSDEQNLPDADTALTQKTEENESSKTDEDKLQSEQNTVDSKKETSKSESQSSNEAKTSADLRTQDNTKLKPITQSSKIAQNFTAQDDSQPSKNDDDNKTLELFVSANSGSFSLPESLKKKCTISPKRNLRVHVKKVSDRSPIHLRSNSSKRLALTRKSDVFRSGEESAIELSSDYSDMDTEQHDDVIKESKNFVSHISSNSIDSKIRPNVEQKSLTVYRSEDTLSESLTPSFPDIETTRDSPKSNETGKALQVATVDSSPSSSQVSSSGSIACLPSASSSLVLHLDSSSGDSFVDLVDHDEQTLTPKPMTTTTVISTVASDLSDSDTTETDDPTGTSQSHGKAKITNSQIDHGSKCPETPSSDETSFDIPVETHITKRKVIDSRKNSSKVPRKQTQTKCNDSKIQLSSTSSALLAIKENYTNLNDSNMTLDNHDMQHSITLVDEIIPTATDDEESEDEGLAENEKLQQPNSSNAGDNGESSSAANPVISDSKSDPPVEKRIFKRPCILIFDSLRGTSRSKIAVSLREYLTMEWKTRKEKTHGPRIFDKVTMKMCTVPVPQQDNYTDCGLFLLHYVEKFFTKPIASFFLPIKELEHWFDPSECSEKRTDIKNIIHLLRKARLEKKKEAT